MNVPLTQEQVKRELIAMINLNVVVSSNNNIYLPHVYKQECETALKVAQMALEVPKPVNLVPVMEQVKSQLDIKLFQRQAEGVEMVFKYNLSIITGGSGTGKSTILLAVIDACTIRWTEGKTMFCSVLLYVPV